MGEARRRGSYEQRKEQSIARSAAEKEKKRLEAQAAWDALTDEEKEAKRKKEKKGSVALGIALGMAAAAAAQAK